MVKVVLFETRSLNVQFISTSKLNWVLPRPLQVSGGAWNGIWPKPLSRDMEKLAAYVW